MGHLEAILGHFDRRTAPGGGLLREECSGRSADMWSLEIIVILVIVVIVVKVVIVVIVVIPARSAGFYNCTCKKKTFRKYRNSKRKNTYHNGVLHDPTRPDPTRPDPTRPGHPRTCTVRYRFRRIFFVLFRVNFQVSIIPIRSILWVV